MKGLGKWVERKSARSPEQAIALLRAAAPSVAGAVPWRFVGREAVHQAIGNRDLNARIASAPVREVPLKSLVGIQHTISPARVEQYIRDPELAKGVVNPKTGTPADLPIVVRLGGFDYLWDGNHRACAAFFLGSPSIRARYVDLDA